MDEHNFKAAIIHAAIQRERQGYTKAEIAKSEFWTFYAANDLDAIRQCQLKCKGRHWALYRHNPHAK